MATWQWQVGALNNCWVRTVLRTLVASNQSLHWQHLGGKAVPECCGLDPAWCTAHCMNCPFFSLIPRPLWSVPYPLVDFDVDVHIHFAGSCHSHLQNNLPVLKSLNQEKHFPGPLCWDFDHVHFSTV